MEKYIFDESNGLWYELNGDYYLPCFTLPEVETKEIGVWGMRHLDYLKSRRKATDKVALISERYLAGGLSCLLKASLV